MRRPYEINGLHVAYVSSKIGYARTSTDDQTTALQLATLKKAGCTKTFEDKGISGTIKKRPAFTRCLAALQSGDTLTVWKLDRLGRSLRDLIDHLDELRGRGVRLQSITEAIDTETLTGRGMWQLVGVLAELERSMITERTKAGVKEAKKRGVKFGPKPKLTPAQIKHARQQIDKGERVQDVAALLSVDRTTLYRALKF